MRKRKSSTFDSFIFIFYVFYFIYKIVVFILKSIFILITLVISIPYLISQSKKYKKEHKEEIKTNDLNDYENVEYVKEIRKTSNIKENSILSKVMEYREKEDKKRELVSQEEYKQEHEKLKKDWGLLDYEADLVQKGDYDPWYFNESGEEFKDYEE